MPVDSFRFLPRILSYYYQMLEPEPVRNIPWTPLPAPLDACTFGLVTTAGLFHRGAEPPFDINRERQEPTWGDPGYRTLPGNLRQDELGVSHLHYATGDVQTDMNILLPLHRFRYLVAEGTIGGLASHAYSFTGYQGYPTDTTAWQHVYGPEVAEKLRTEGVDCVFLTPA
jgi:D-proline reductase (dithiol) PrdB